MTVFHENTAARCNSGVLEGRITVLGLVEVEFLLLPKSFSDSLCLLLSGEASRDMAGCGCSLRNLGHLQLLNLFLKSA